MKITRYLLIKTILSIIAGGFVFLLFGLILHLPMALIFALIFFILNYIPHIVPVPILFELGPYYRSLHSHSSHSLPSQLFTRSNRNRHFTSHRFSLSFSLYFSL